MWSTSQGYESEEEDDLESSLYHNSSGMHIYIGFSYKLEASKYLIICCLLYTGEGEDYSDQSYDVSNEDNDSYEEASDDSQEISDISPEPSEQRFRIATMAEIFKTMFQGGQSSSTTPLPNLKTTRIEHFFENL